MAKDSNNNPRVTVLPITEGATLDPHNINKHTQRGGALLENSLRKRGAFRSIASAGKGVQTPVVMAGNYTLEKAIDAGFTEIVNVHVTGNQIVNVVRDDLDPRSAEAIALGIEDNEIGRQSYAPDVDMLAALAAGDNAILAALSSNDAMFSGLLDDINFRAGKLFLDAADGAQELTPALPNNNVYSLTFPCSKEEREKVIATLNDVKRIKELATSTEALLVLIESYANP